MFRLPRVLVPALAALALLPLLSCAPKRAGGTRTKIVIWEQMDAEERNRFEANLAGYRGVDSPVEIQHIPYETQ